MVTFARRAYLLLAPPARACECLVGCRVWQPFPRRGGRLSSLRSENPEFKGIRARGIPAGITAAELGGIPAEIYLFHRSLFVCLRVLE